MTSEMTLFILLCAKKGEKIRFTAVSPLCVISRIKHWKHNFRLFFLIEKNTMHTNNPTYYKMFVFIKREEEGYNDAIVE
jgi:hypothetical protein